MLLQPTHYQYPFQFFTLDTSFSQEQCTMLEQLFVQESEWQHRDGAFYRCALRDVTAAIPLAFHTEVLARMRAITGLPLINQFMVTAQRMLPGQVIGTHSDRPLLGYEIARLVVQLNRHWQTEHGGVLELFASPDGEAVFKVNPDYNKAFGFVLHAESYHGVTEVTQPRNTMVFNFWHKANTPELADHLQALFENLHFSELPAALDPIAAEAEMYLPEDLTYRAGTAAIALQRWGYDAATVISGYQHSAGISACDTRGTETYAAVLLADWVAYVYREVFDLARWEILRSELDGSEKFSRLNAIWELCLPQ